MGKQSQKKDAGHSRSHAQKIRAKVDEVDGIVNNLGTIFSEYESQVNTMKARIRFSGKSMGQAIETTLRRPINLAKLTESEKSKIKEIYEKFDHDSKEDEIESNKI